VLVSDFFVAISGIQKQVIQTNLESDEILQAGVHPVTIPAKVPLMQDMPLPNLEQKHDRAWTMVGIKFCVFVGGSLMRNQEGSVCIDGAASAQTPAQRNLS
jgi:hypothetical protein